MKETIEHYRGFVIRSYVIGRYVAKRAYKCGKEKAPTKKLLKKFINTYLSDPKKYELDISFLESTPNQKDE